MEVAGKEIIKHLIQRESCRLIVKEAPWRPPGDFVIKLNNYIDGTDTAALNLSFDGAVSSVSEGGFTTTGLPTASAGPTFRLIIASRKLEMRKKIILQIYCTLW